MSNLIKYHELAFKFNYPTNIFEETYERWANLSMSSVHDDRFKEGGQFYPVPFIVGNYEVWKDWHRLSVSPHSQKHLDNARSVEEFGICSGRCIKEGEHLNPTQVCGFLDRDCTSLMHDYEDSTSKLVLIVDSNSLKNEDVFDIFMKLNNYCYYCNKSLLKIKNIE